ncbi:NYN domain-containing protein [Rhodococcus pyridinivorans]|uniref:NYN domain-containing protein n=1 Tax=Rhodococcus pyridinivorans TaxID=103816 RepID=UPI001E4B9A3F|nr:NYN domain-containing protein [Rhodococcus pyridinivorans]MCD5422681.1 NYN domain-containing protein [Rhodococcus pyridinivorans]
MSNTPASCKVILDLWNMLDGMASVLPWGRPSNTLDLNLGRVADVIAAKSNRPIRCDEIAVHLGVCDSQRHPQRYATEQAMIRRWQRDPRVSTRIRPNRFDPATGTYTEKGVDTAIALDLCTSQASGRFDAVVLFTADVDLLPALEQAYRAPGTVVQLARWKDQPSSLWLPGEKLWCFFLDEADLAQCSVPHTTWDIA